MKDVLLRGVGLRSSLYFLIILMLSLPVCLAFRNGMHRFPARIVGSINIKKVTSLQNCPQMLPSTLEFSLAELESYESSGVPIWALVGSVAAVGITLAIPILSRKKQVAKNSKATDNAQFLAAADEKDAYEKFYKNRSNDKTL